MTRLVLSELFVINLLLFEHHQQQKMLVSWQFSGPYGVTKYGSSWRKAVVNQCLEFVLDLLFHLLPCTVQPASTFSRLWHLLVYARLVWCFHTNWHWQPPHEQARGPFWLTVAVRMKTTLAQYFLLLLFPVRTLFLRYYRHRKELLFKLSPHFRYHTYTHSCYIYPFWFKHAELWQFGELINHKSVSDW